MEIILIRVVPTNIFRIENEIKQITNRSNPKRAIPLLHHILLKNNIKIVKCTICILHVVFVR